MEAPQAFLDDLKLVDPNLFPRWNQRINRWQILLRNPRTPNRPPQVAKTVTEPDGSFRPLDRRTIKWFYEADLHRRFHGYREQEFGRLVEEQLQREQAGMDAEKDRAKNEKWNEVIDRVTFALSARHPKLKMKKTG